MLPLRELSIRAVLISAILVLLAVPSTAAPPDPNLPNAWCGTHDARLDTTIALHDWNQRRLERERAAAGLPRKMEPVSASQFGGLAILEDNGSLIIPANRFDLSNTQMQYLRRPKGTGVVRAAVGFKELIGDRINLGDDASRRINFPDDFRFPFHDEVYDHAFVNSDGNITFEQPFNTSAAPRDLQTFTDGPPRVAPLFTDLDPSAATGTEGVYVLFLPGRFRVTWLGVPEFGGERRTTMQVTFFTNGRIVFVYQDVDIDVGVVGVTPGRGGDVNVYDYDAELPEPPRPGGVAESFVEDSTLDDAAVGKAFFANFRDVYDHLIMWLDFPFILGQGTFAYELTVKNNIRGIGEPISDFSSIFGSDSRLESIIQMGSLLRFPTDPDELFLGPDSAMSVLGHEAGHRWLVKARFVDPRTGRVSQDLLGRQLAHWSYNMDSDGSVDEGNDWRDNQDGTFTSGIASRHYGPLDRYLMGLIPAAQVPPFFFVDNANGPGAASGPETGAVIRGDRVNLTLNDIIAVEGPRVPPFPRSRDRFFMAFVLVTRQGEPPSQETLDKLEGFRQRFNTWWPEATGGTSTINTVMRPR